LEVIYLNLLMSIDLTPGMVLAEEVTAKDDLPPFRASVMVKYSFFYKVLGRLCDQE
jgi:molybdopterin biosynthesis enzyme